MTAPLERVRPASSAVGPIRLSLTARRVVVAAVGGVLAFGAGTGMAFAFRVSPDVTAADAPDPTVADQLPSEAAARAYALNNPPAYAVQAKTPTESVLSPMKDDVDNTAPTLISDDDTAEAMEPPARTQPNRPASNDDAAVQPAVASTDSSDHAGAAGPSD